MQRQTGGGGTEVYNSRFQAPVRGGNRFTLLTDGRFFFDRLLAAIDGSKEYVLAEFYLVESGQVADRFIAAFARATARGVRVRILFDAIGARALREVDRVRLRAAGAELVLFNVPRWRALTCVLVRDHRKLLLVDGTTGFTGGVGIADMFSPTAQPEHYWLDCIVEITGPVLEDWHALFARTWVRSTRRKLDVSPSPSRSVPHLHLCSPGSGAASPQGLALAPRNSVAPSSSKYARPTAESGSPRLIFGPRAVCGGRCAARCGIDVRLLLPGPLTDAPAARSVARLFYSRLLANGVVIYEYQPRFLHAKIVLCDDWVSVGSSNLDRWGLLWNLEANQEIDSPAFAAQVEAMLVRTFGSSVALRNAADVRHHWSVPFWHLITRAILAWSTRTVARLRRR